MAIIPDKKCKKESKRESRNGYMNKKKTLWLFLIYAIGCLTPYFIPALNQVEPWICGIPFTVYSIFIWMAFCCGLLNYLSKHVWDSYDDNEKE